MTYRPGPAPGPVCGTAESGATTGGHPMGLARRVFTRLCAVPLGVAAGLSLAGCPLVDSLLGQLSGQSTRLVPFKDDRELVAFYARQNAGPRNAMFLGDAGAVALAGGSETAADGSSGAFTTTNVQEVGVDESDVLKTDGTYFYLADGATLRIVRAQPPDAMQQVGSIELSRRIRALYLRGDYVIALLPSYGDVRILAGQSIDALIWPPYFTQSQLTIAQIDITDPAAPAITRQITLDGSLVTSRLTNDRLIVILTHLPPDPPGPIPAILGAVSADDVLPKITLPDGTQRRVVEATDVLHPDAPEGYAMTVVVTLDADDIATVVGSTAVMADAGTIYASTEALYLTDPDLREGDFTPVTTIHKLAFDDDGVARYTASGQVPGRPLNQFSLGEYQGVLRIATHVANLRVLPLIEPGIAVDAVQGAAQAAETPSEPFNAVYTLREQAGELKIIGRVEGIAPGERLFAARFIADRGYLVTFRQIDPFFVVDLSDPQQPRLAGELKVPGFSDYLHPLENHRVIGVGRSVDTSSGGAVPKALQLSLFDVSDPNDPQLIQQLELGGFGSHSDVSFDAKAFAILPQRGLFVLPAVLTPDDTQPFEHLQPAFDGVLVFRIAETGFEELGRIANVGPAAPPGVEIPFLMPDWRRGAIIDQTAYAITPAGVRAAPLTDPTATYELELP